MSKDQDDFSIRNRVLLAFGEDVLDTLRHALSIRPLSAGQRLYSEGEPFTHAIFPHSGVVSLRKTEPSGVSAEKASIGNEGFVGAALLFGGEAALSTSVVAVAGYASWLEIDALNEVTAREPAVMAAVKRYARALIFQLMESSACVNIHSAEQRLARWLLTTDDRCNRRAIPVTQATIAEVMSLRRATVNIILKGFSESNAIQTGNGVIQILDRQGLLSRGCGCYSRISEVFSLR
ncbi:MAG: Crp/Fnr family transcriptional regulator [Phreatobacter sp.]|uniref:Crp/Fnr family transcriptional regulator n=1 Tax=Phreatobacter sp. TaxID=1966341 RepID=UPI001A5113D2|nr:Crp/Fnr family transcriptional regulator [Phreatobacter sp.]MBL8571294.1 Crp/Fnr family transcriptional regulator [Phreatobacter sp.]